MKKKKSEYQKTIEHVSDIIADKMTQKRIDAYINYCELMGNKKPSKLKLTYMRHAEKKLLYGLTAIGIDMILHFVSNNAEDRLIILKEADRVITEHKERTESIIKIA